MNQFKTQADLVKENCGGMDKLGNPHNFSSNPGFMSTADMLGASTPADPIIRGTSARGSLHPTRVGASPSRAIFPANGR